MKSEIGRRDMLKSVLAGMAGIGTWNLTSMLSLKPAGAAGIAGKEGMPGRVLGKTGCNVSLFSLGGESTVEQRGRRDKAVEIINKAIDNGVNFIDTSHIYGGGGSEENIGVVMSRRREDVFLATKTGRQDYDGAMKECETSLRRLKTDHIDFYQHHALRNEEDVDRRTGDDSALTAFKKLKDEGTVSYLGVTGHSPRILLRALDKFDYDTVLITLNPAGMSMQDPDYLDVFFKTASERNIGVIGMKVAGKGRIFRRGITMKQAFNYTLSHPVATAVIGITEPDQILENCELARSFAQLDDESLKQIEAEAAG